MAKEYNWLEHEILGDINEIAPPLRPAPDLPVLDEPQALRKHSGNAADSTIAAIEFDSMVDQLCPIPVEAQIESDVRKFSPEQPASGFDAVLNKLVEEVLPSVVGMQQLTPQTSAYVKRFLDTYTKTPAPSRRAEVAKGDSRRSLDVAEIVDHWAERYELPTIGTTGDALSRIKRSMAALTNQIVLEATI